jgi:hypothetical protein
LALASQAKAFPKSRLTPMAKIIPITEHYQHFLAEMKESFWGDVYGETKRLPLRDPNNQARIDINKQVL